MRLKLSFFLMLSAGLSYSLISCFSYSLKERLSTAQILLFQDAVAMIALIPLLKWKKISLKTSCFPVHLIRDLAALAASFFWLLSLKSLGLVNAALLQFTSPFYVPFLGYLWFGEKIPKGIWKAIACGFIGILLILKPNGDILKEGAFLGVLTGMTSALGLTALRRLNLKGEPVERILFYLFLVSSILAFPFAIGSWASISLQDGLFLSLLGVSVLINNLLLTSAFRYAPASYLAPMSYLTVLFNALLGWVFFQKTTSGLALLGGIFVTMGACFIYFLKEKKEKQATVTL